MALQISRVHAGTSATLIVALASASYLAISGDAHGAAALPRPSTDLTTALETTMPTIRSICDLLAGAWQHLSLHREAGGSLRELDARALADIGVDRSDIDSIEAESLGRSDVTRRRIVEAACHG